ncbi:MAG: hypothetical protein IIC67_01310 [Thaumarchaeota archaeon]|nr:hypothetical protein [Nitrososphaerota archaeon]
MNAKLNDKTVMRISQILNQPISRGIDKAINSCLDKLEKSQVKFKGDESHNN